jgi:hypothetical protein
VNAPPIGTGKMLAPRSAAFQRFMALPVAFAAILMLATGALAALSWFGGSASGPRAHMVFQGSCAAEARPLLAARAEAMGLEKPEWSLVGDRLELTATLPGLDDDLEAVPRLLSRRGQLELRRGTTVVVAPEHVEGASIRLDESGAAYTWIDLSKAGITSLEAALEAEPDGELTVISDGTEATPRPNSRGVADDGIRVLPVAETPGERMRRAADLAIVLTHGPLTCDINVVSATPVADDGGAG